MKKFNGLIYAANAGFSLGMWLHDMMNGMYGFAAFWMAWMLLNAVFAVLVATTKKA